MSFQYDYNKVADKLKIFSDRYHKLSLLFYELSQSIRLEGKKKSAKEFKLYLKSLNLDIEKIKKLTKGMAEIEMGDLRKE